MGHEIQLDGTEISIIKAIGIGGGDVDGEALLQRCKGIDMNEMIETIKGLIDLGYVDADASSLYGKEDLKEASFRVNPGWAKDLKDALDPPDEPKKSKRVRRE